MNSRPSLARAARRVGAGVAFALWAPQPDWFEPMLARTGRCAPLAGPWIWEPRLAGVRCMVWTGEGRVELRDARGEPVEAASGLLERIGGAVRGEAVLDAVLGGRLLHVVDCLHYEGADLRALPLLDRKAVLRDALRADPAVRAVPFEPAAGSTVAGTGARGLIAKRTTSRYVSGYSDDWRAFAQARTGDGLAVRFGGAARPASGTPAGAPHRSYSG